MSSEVNSNPERDPRTAPPLRVVLADSHVVSREGAKGFLNDRSVFEVVGEASSAAELFVLLDTVKPDVLVLDPSRFNTLAYLFLTQLQLQCPGCTVIVYGEPGCSEYRRALQHPAVHGCLSKDLERAEFRSGLLHGVLSARLRPSELPPLSFTSQELDMLRLLGEGCTNQTMSDALRRPEPKLRGQLSELYKKLHVSSRTQAALFTLFGPRRHIKPPANSA